MRLREDEGGQTLVLVALSMTFLLGFMALAIDVGLLFRAHRNVQIAADAAAIAAALDYKYNNSITSAQTAGQSAASINGVTNGSGVAPRSQSTFLQNMDHTRGTAASLRQSFSIRVQQSSWG